MRRARLTHDLSRPRPWPKAGVPARAGWPAPAPSAPAAPLSRAAEVSDAKWDLLLLCVAGYLLVSVGRLHQLFPILQPIRPALLTGGVGLMLYLFDGREERRLRRLLVPTTKLLLGLLGWIALSVPGSLWPGNSFDMVADDFVKTVLMFLVVAGAVRGARDVERLAAVYLLAATAYAAVVVARFDLGGGDRWRLDDLYYYDANDFATFAVTAMPFGLYFLHASRRLLGRVLGAAALGTLALAFVWTGSRGGFVALVAVTAFVVLRYTGIPLRWRLSGTALVALVVLTTASETYWRQMSTILADADYNRTDESGRLQIWQRGLGYMLEHPVLGVGANNFAVAEGMLSPFAQRQQFGVGVRWNAAHNSYLQAGVELGVPGLVLLVCFIAAAFRALRQARRDEDAAAGARGTVQLTQALTASLIGFVVGAFFLSLAYSAILYTLAALAVALQKVTADGSPAPARFVPARPHPRAAGAAAAARFPRR